MNTLELLNKTKIEVSPETFYIVSLENKEFNKLLENPELSPRMTNPFMIFKDKWEITLILDETDFTTCRHAIRDAKFEGGFRLLSFDFVLDFSVVGFLSEITKILAEANISVFVVSAFSRDHIFIKQNDLAKTLVVLGQYVEELC